MNDVSDAMIVAGGRGTRLRPLTLTQPKPLIEFCGEPFLVSVMRRLAGAGITRVFLVVGADTTPFGVLHAPARDLGIEVVVVPEPQPLDTAGGVRSVVAEVSGTFLVLNGDVLTDVDVTAAIDHHMTTGADATLVLTEVDDTSAFGVCVRDGSRIVDFVEKPAPGSLPGQRGVNAGTYVLEPSVLLAHDEGRLSFERDVFPGLVARGGHLEGIVWEGAWADLGTPERFREGTRLALDGELDWPSVTAVPERAPGVRIHPAATVHPEATLVPPVLIRAGATVGGSATIGPYVVLGDDTIVGDDVRLTDSILLAGAAVRDGVDTDGLILGEGATIASGARIGRDVVVGDGEQVATGEELADGARVPSPPYDS